MKFMEMLRNAWRNSNSLVCVGLDPDLKKLPEKVRETEHPIFEFNKAIIDATAAEVCCYKPQIAYYSGQGADEDLLLTMRYLKSNYPSIPVILDAKRADIGATTNMYAREAFERFHADAVTVNPYMGMDAIKPFLDYAEKGVVVLCRTSNPGAKEIQEVKTAEGIELYKHVARLVAGPWNYNGNTLLVAGATFPEELGQIRTIVGDTPLLVRFRNNETEKRGNRRNRSSRGFARDGYEGKRISPQRLDASSAGDKMGARTRCDRSWVRHT